MVKRLRVSRLVPYLIFLGCSALAANQFTRQNGVGHGNVIPSAADSILQALYHFSFDSLTLEAEGFAKYGDVGIVELGDFPSVPDTISEDVTNRHGLIMTCSAGERVLVYTTPTLPVDSHPYNANLYIGSNSAEGIISISAMDREFDSKNIKFSLLTTGQFMNTFKQVSVVHQPVLDATTGEVPPQTIAIQLAAFPSAKNPVTLYIDNLEIVPFESNPQNNPSLPKVE